MKARLTDSEINKRAAYMVEAMSRVKPVTMAEAKSQIIASMEEFFAAERLSQDETEYCADLKRNGYSNLDQLERD